MSPLPSFLFPSPLVVGAVGGWGRGGGLKVNRLDPEALCGVRALVLEWGVPGPRCCSGVSGGRQPWPTTYPPTELRVLAGGWLHS